MNFKIIHCNINITDIKKSLDFYKKALGFEVVRTKEAKDGSFILNYIARDNSPFQIELTWLKDHHQKYDLGENESHIAFETDDFAAAYELHKAMGCICFENPEMGIYFIEDPDGYWLEILPKKA